MSDTSKAECLFIGGPWDGRRIAVEQRCDSLRAPKIERAPAVEEMGTEPVEKQDESVLYRRAKLFSPCREWPVFVAAGIDDVMSAVIAGYGVASQGHDQSI